MIVYPFDTPPDAGQAVTVAPGVELDRGQVPFERIGTTGGDALVIGGQSVALADLREASDSFFRDWMES